MPCKDETNKKFAPRVFVEIEDVNIVFINATFVERDENVAFDAVKLTVERVEITPKSPAKTCVDKALVKREEINAKFPNNENVERELIDARFAAKKFVDKVEIKAVLALNRFVDKLDNNR